MTDALGAFAATEIYSSGLYRPVRQFENRKKTNVFQALGIGDGEATGAQLYYGGNGLHVTAGLYVPVFGASARSDTDGFKTIARAVYEFNVQDTTVAIGGYHIGGKVARKLIDYNTEADDDDNVQIIHKVDSIDTDALDRTSYGIDLQVESAISGMPLMVTGGYVLSNKYNGIYINPTSPKKTSATYTPTAQDKTGFHLDAQINPFDTFGVKAAILGVNDDKFMVYSAGLEYSFTQNVRFCFEYSYTSSDIPDTATQNYSGSDLLFMAMVAF